MDVNEEPEIHPLDRDYSSDHLPKPSRRAIIAKKFAYKPSTRVTGVVFFTAGLLMLILSGIVTVNVPGNSSAETIASGAQRISMFVMLFGAIVILGAYQNTQK